MGCIDHFSENSAAPNDIVSFVAGCKFRMAAEPLKTCRVFCEDGVQLFMKGISIAGCDSLQEIFRCFCHRVSYVQVRCVIATC